MKYYILDSLSREPNKPFKIFNKKNELKSWLLGGLYGTEGAEQEHYVDMLSQLDLGKTTLDYNWKYSKGYDMEMKGLIKKFGL